MLRLWWHAIPFGFLGLFSLVELGLTGDWVNSITFYNSRVGFVLFTSIWTFLSLLAHWSFPFIVAGAWSAFTALLWLVSAAVLSARSCSTVDYGIGGTVRFCLSDSSRWQAMTAFAWINFLLMLAILGCIWWYVMRTKQVTWRHGIYGRSFYMHPTDQGVRGGNSLGMKSASPTTATAQGV